MTILIIDDEPALRRSLGGYLEDSDIEYLEAPDGAEGLRVLRENRDSIEAVIVDLNMPVMDGYEFITHAVAESNEVPIIVLSGVGVLEDAIKAIRLGAWDFITKPLQSFDILTYTLSKVLERARLLRENREYQENLEGLVRIRTAELEETRRQIMQRLSRAAEYKDNETGRHVIRVGQICKVIGRAMGMDVAHYERLCECAPLHDVGKIGIPDDILLKPGKLSPSEREIMRQHCEYGGDILGPLTSTDEAPPLCTKADRETTASENEMLNLARCLALYHHERWDGDGYPFGLKGEEIPLEARIVSVVDVYDALCSKRPYKEAFSEELAGSILRDGSGTQFDPAVIEVFFANLPEIRHIRDIWSG